MDKYVMKCSLSNGKIEEIEMFSDSFEHAYFLAQSIAKEDFREGELDGWEVEKIEVK